MSEFFTLGVYTASDQAYADAILEVIDPSREFLKLRLYREQCIATDFGYVKDLLAFDLA